MAEPLPLEQRQRRRRELALSVAMFVVIGLISASLSWFGLSDMVDRHVYNLFNQILGPAYGKTSSDAEALAERALRHVDPSPPLPISRTPQQPARPRTPSAYSLLAQASIRR